MKTPELTRIASSIQDRLHERGHVGLSVRPFRGNALVEAEGRPLARLTPTPDGVLYLSYQTHDRKWEPMPFSAKSPSAAADLVIDVLGPHIQALTDT